MLSCLVHIHALKRVKSNGLVITKANLFLNPNPSNLCGIVFIDTSQVRIDAALKEEAEKTLKSMGLSMSTAIQLFCRQVVNQRRIPFEIIAPDSVNETTRRSMDDTLKGKNLSRKFSSVGEMWEDLNA